MRIIPKVLASILVSSPLWIAPGCGPVESADGELSTASEAPEAAVGNISWNAPGCDAAGHFVGCNQTGQPICTDAGGPYFSNWDATLGARCSSACGSGNRDAYCGWKPATCDGGVLSGCARVGQPTCTDWGSSGFPNWNGQAWTACQQACTQPDRNAVCQWAPRSVVASTAKGCARTGQPVCTDWGGPSFPNWSQAAWDTCQSTCTSSCPGANPNDNLPDDAALQACLDAGGTIKLIPGSVGYIVSSTLRITKSNTVLTSAAAPGRARLVAAPGLRAVMIEALNVSNVTLSHLEIDGNRPSRSKADCQGYRIAGTTVSFGSVNAGKVLNSRFTRAVCGSALQLLGTGIEVANNLFDDNGAGREAIDAPEPWSDGVTLVDCPNAFIHDNSFTDCTDVAIPDGGGAGARIQSNIVLQLNRHAFAGIQLGNFTSNGKGIHTGTVVSGNLIRGNGLMSFGLGASMMPWGNARTTGGTLSGNDVSGSIVNLVIDGADGVTVTGNVLGATAGAAQCGGAPTPYTVDDAPGSSLQPGWVARSYGPSPACIP